MAFSRLYACDTCETGEAVLTFAETWGADSDESAPSAYTGYGKIRGLFSKLWCPTCRDTEPLILLRLEPPADHAVVAYAEAQRRGLTGNETGECARCGTRLMSDAEAEPCTHCETGTLRFVGEWEDAS